MITNDNSYSVYCHTNMTNGKKYFGKAKNIKKRWGKNGRGYTNNHDTIFSNAIMKYGWDGFKHEIIASNLSPDEAADLEVYYIKKYKTNISRYGNAFGYNMTDGRDGASGISAGVKAVVCVETGDVFLSMTDACNTYGISNTHLTSVCKHRRQSACGLSWRYADDDDIARYNVTRNNHISEQERTKIIEDAQARTAIVNRNSLRDVCIKAVRCVETNMIYKSMTEAAESVHTDIRNLSNCLHGRSKTCGGFHWQFADEGGS